MAEGGTGGRRTGVRVRAVLGGAAAAWLVAQVFLLVMTVGVGVAAEAPLRLNDVVAAVAAFGWLMGLMCVVLAPAAALLAAAAPGLRGSGAAASGLLGAVGGIALAQLLAAGGPLVAVAVAVVGSVCGLAGWATSLHTSRSSVRAGGLLATAGGVWMVAVLAI